MKYKHYSVMLDEAVEALNIKPDGVYVDCTLGGGGHTAAILDKISENGLVIATDRDLAAIENAQLRFSGNKNIRLIHDNFINIGNILEQLDIRSIDGAVIDLGVSSYQLDTAERGFSYMADAPLDMRMDTSEPLTAYTVVNSYSEKSLVDILFKYGEERYAKRIAERICNERSLKPIATTGELVDIIKAAVPAKAQHEGHPAKRTFQALRIEVNGELAVIEPTLRSLVDALKPGGRLAVISFHSLEDRIVKHFIAAAVKGCTCPDDFPVCVCGKAPELISISKKPVLPSTRELTENDRSHSAKLRVAEKKG